VRGQLSERELLLAAKECRGEARGAMIVAFMPQIGHVARGYGEASGVGRAELMQHGAVGLLRALERYDPELGTPFWAYASWWVRQAMQQLVSEPSRPVVLPDRRDRLVDAGAEEAYKRAARRLALTSVLPRIASLSSREQTILRGRYGLDRPVQTLRELGADLGISAERVRQLEQRALDTLHAAAT
jgi:RNA polymerase sigma factor (sigma-70 family)